MYTTALIERYKAGAIDIPDEASTATYLLGAKKSRALGFNRILQTFKMSTDAESAPVSEEKKEKSWKRFIWDSLDKSPEERRLVLKLDLTLLTLGCLGNLLRISPKHGLLLNIR